MRHVAQVVYDRIVSAPDASLALTPALDLVLVAQIFVGLNEARPDDLKIINGFRETIGSAVGQSWCLDFIQTCIAEVETVPTFGKSALPETQSVLDLWNKAKNYMAIQDPRPGDIILWQHGKTWQGHCGVIVSIDSLLYHTIEGNTSDSKKIDREGDGVYLKARAKGGTATMKELGFIRPFP